MRRTGPRLSVAALAAALVVSTALVSDAAPHPLSQASAVAPEPGPVRVAQAEGETQPELQPRYQPVPPVPPEQQGSFNDEYVFGLTRGIADSALHPAAKIMLFPMTVPLDIVLLPFEVIGGFF